MSVAVKKKAGTRTVNDLEQIFEDRRPQREAFLKKTGWADAAIRPLNEDCAFRRYYRLEKNGKTVLALDSLKEMEDKVAPKHRLSDVVTFSKLLSEAGLNVPDVYDHDLENGYALIEDFGDTTFTKALQNGADEAELYHMATEVLMTFRTSEALGALAPKLDDYYDTLIHANRVDLVHWYRPAALYEENPDGMLESYLAAWDAVEAALPPCPRGFTHGDFHLDNMMYVASEKGLRRCGVIDFQGAVNGPVPYDLVNLLEDARKTLPADLKAALKEKYCADMGAEERAVFDAWYRVLGTQFHCRVIGLFVRLLVRDNKPVYINHVPRLQNYIVEGLKDPVLAPLKAWFKESGLDISRPLPDFDLPRLRALLKLEN